MTGITNATHFIAHYNKIEGIELNKMTEVQLIGYYCKNFRLCMVDKLLDDINNRVVPYVLGMRVKSMLEALNYGGDI